MGFLRRLLGVSQPPVSAWPPPGPITSWPSGDPFNGELRIMRFDPPSSGATVEVVGESKYQGSLKALAAGFDLNGPRVRDHRAVLLPEPDNIYDKNAVRVIIVPPDAAAGHWGAAGYLSRDDAVAFRPVIDRLAGLGWVTGCRASLKGGHVRESGARNFLGVTLHLAPPAELMAELDHDNTKPSWQP